MGKKTLLTPAVMTSYRPKVAGNFTLSFETQILDDNQKMDVIQHYQQFGWLGFVDSEDATDLEIPEEDPTREGKKPSERLRNSLYVLWTKKFPDGKPSEFEAWRLNYMESIIEQVKDKIRDYE